MLTVSITRNGLLLATYALITAALIAGTFLLTENKIKTEKRLSQQRALLEIVPEFKHDNDLLEDILEIRQQDSDLLGLSDNAVVYVARFEGSPVAYIYPSVAKDGYSGDIELLIGVNIDGSLAGVRVLAHKETPGLGDKIDLKKSSWILVFAGKSLSNPQADVWKVKKDGGEFDQFTGATITPRAVVRRVKHTLEFHRKLVAKNKVSPEKNIAETSARVNSNE